MYCVIVDHAMFIYFPKQQIEWLQTGLWRSCFRLTDTRREPQVNSLVSLDIHQRGELCLGHDHDVDDMTMMISITEVRPGCDHDGGGEVISWSWWKFDDIHERGALGSWSWRRYAVDKVIISARGSLQGLARFIREHWNLLRPRLDSICNICGTTWNP